jgi:hypothetical protein
MNGVANFPGPDTAAIARGLSKTLALGEKLCMKLERVHQPAEPPELRSPFDGCNLVDVRKNHERADIRKRLAIARAR